MSWTYEKVKAELASVAKAAIAFVLPGLVFVAAQLVGDQSFSDLTTAQWILFAIAVFGTPAAVYAIPNKSKG